ncbi:hypothetical protein SUDANB21_04583 [Streptomyces sp. enrichment culture]|uniref:Uncharacterized protein n=1 Tax=Streptomyces thermodiastaticus TaxID=44061 RepID=A0ABU0K8U5_9ACTN|nr:hypothetical protein [Streptomyces thermodiastaticus]
MRLTEAASTTVESTVVPSTSSSRMISKRKGFSLRLVILLKENYWVKAHRPDGLVCRTLSNELRGANIPYAKENFRSAKY